MAKLDEQSTSDTDTYLQELFATSERDIADEGFSDRVLAKIARRQQLRFGMVAGATGLGAVIALSQATQPISDLLQWLPANIENFSAPNASTTTFSIAGALFVAILTPLVTRMLEE